VLAHERVEAEVAHGRHRLREGAHAGQDEPIRGTNAVGIAGDLHVGTHPLERLLHRAQVAHAVVEDADRRANAR
jgi:hypothetical protein